MQDFDVTIAVIPRERFSRAVPSLESIYANTRAPVQLVYIDGNSPRRIRRYLQTQSKARGFSLVRTNHYLTPNEARNLALQHVKTKYVIFIDNDIEVSPGWADALVTCAEETGAWVVSPLVMAGERGHESIHHAGGRAYIKEIDGRRLFVEEHFHLEQPLEETPLQRARSEFVEFHTALVRTDCFARLGKMDEQLMSMYEHLDFCMRVREAGGEIFTEPGAMVTYYSSVPKFSDLGYYFLRWGDDWNEATQQRFRTKWRLADDDPSVRYSRDWVTEFRQAPLWKLRPFVDRLTRGRSFLIERRFLSPLEKRICRIVARWAGRSRPASKPAFPLTEPIRQPMDAI